MTPRGPVVAAYVGWRWCGEGEARGPSGGRIADRACGARSPVRWGGKVERVTPCVLRRTGEGWALEASLSRVGMRRELQRYYWCKYCF